jgi:hypothetical protein
MGVIAGANINDNGLIFSLDAANFRSYSGSGLTSFSLVGGIGGTLVNGTGFSGANSGSFILDGTNDYIIANTQSLNNAPYTLEIAFKISSLSSGDMRLAGAYSGSTSQLTFGFDNYTFRLWLQDTWQNSSFIASLNTFYILSVIHQSSDTYIYVNGSYNSTIYDRTSSFDNLGIGNPFVFTYGSYFNGNIHNFNHYNRALSAQEVKQNYNATKRRYSL